MLKFCQEPRNLFLGAASTPLILSRSSPNEHTSVAFNAHQGLISPTLKPKAVAPVFTQPPGRKKEEPLPITATTMDQAVVDHYALKLESFRHVDREREELITELLRKYDVLLTEYRRKSDDYDNEVESRRMWQQKETLARNEVKESRYARVSGDPMCKAGVFERRGGPSSCHRLGSLVVVVLAPPLRDPHVLPLVVQVELESSAFFVDQPPSIPLVVMALCI